MSADLFNACEYLLDRHVREGRGDRLALTGESPKWLQVTHDEQLRPARGPGS